MVVRAILALGGMSFLVSGIAISLSDSCQSVVWGDAGNDRAGRFSATCVQALDQGMSQAMAASAAIAIGMAILLVAIVPLLGWRRRTEPAA